MAINQQEFDDILNDETRRIDEDSAWVRNKIIYNQSSNRNESRCKCRNIRNFRQPDDQVKRRSENWFGGDFYEQPDYGTNHGTKKRYKQTV